jgi:Protein of unknown function (DUF3253)
MPPPNLEAAILALLHDRGPGKTICPSDVARAVDPAHWRPLMQPVRDAAFRLVASGHIVVSQHGHPIDPATAKGPIRLRLR